MSMTRQDMNAWWSARGEAWSAIDKAERDLLCAQRFSRTDENVTSAVRDVIGALKCAREMLAAAVELVEAQANKLPSVDAP